MRFDIITIFPQMYTALDCGITGRAKKNGLIEINCIDLHNFGLGSYHKIDDRPYGGGPGMVLMFEPLKKALKATKALHDAPTSVIYLSPQGKLLKQKNLVSIVSRKNQHFILITGRYEGVDERFIESEVDEEWSIGDYILSGGDLAAMVLIDALTRLLPEALHDKQSNIEESFTDNLLDHPHYTRPKIVEGKSVPKILLSGNHTKIARFRLKQSLGRTWLRRPDLFKQHELTEEEILLLNEFIKEKETNG